MADLDINALLETIRNPPKKSGRERLQDALSDVVSAIGIGMANRGRRGQSTGAGAALAAGPQLRRQRQQDEEAERQQALQNALSVAGLDIRQQAATTGREVQARELDIQHAAALQGQPSPRSTPGRFPGVPEGTIEPREKGFADVPVRGVPSLKVPGYQQPINSAEDLLRRNEAVLRQKLGIEAEFAPPRDAVAAFGSGGLFRKDSGEIVREPWPPAPGAQVTVKLNEEQRQADEGLKETILKSAPNVRRTIFTGLGQATQDRIVGDLIDRGFTEFGKELSDGALQAIDDSTLGIKQLGDLMIMLSEEPGVFGPIRGRILTKVPENISRKINAQVLKTKQTIGKALEGGVLRKEDEAKYDKILARLADEPSLAMFKIRSLLADLNFKRQNFVLGQQRSGRFVAPETIAGVRMSDELIQAYLVFTETPNGQIDIDAARKLAKEDGFEVDQ